jgi:hypothetical protein
MVAVDAEDYCAQILTSTFTLSPYCQNEANRQAQNFGVICLTQCQKVGQVLLLHPISMAEIVASIASVAQIVDLLVKTTRCITDFCREVSDAPRVFQRVQENLTLLQQLLKDV